MTFRGNHPDELISASLTGGLTDTERAALDAHLARCERCRAMLAAFKAERRILSGLPVADPPRDLAARVRAGIEAGRLGAPWWRRRFGVALLASGTMVAAAVLAIIVSSNLHGPVGHATPSPTSSSHNSSAPSAAPASEAPSVAPSAKPPTFLGPGELGYLEVSGGSFAAMHMSFINDATGASIDLGTVSGPPIAASLSPDGQWLAYITQKGETGAHEVWALHLADGTVTPLGCSLDAPFTDRLAWSPDSRSVAYTLVAIDLGPNSGCPDIDGALGGPDAWIFYTTGERSNLTYSGNAFAGSWVAASVVGSAEPRLLVSWAAEQPWTGAVLPESDATFDRIEGVFLPLISPDGNRAIFWNGTMAKGADGVWEFSRGGMPQLSGDFRSTGPASPWIGTPLFTDLAPVGGEAFAYGSFTWGVDSDQFAFWGGAWTGTSQSADGTYPSQQDLYIGAVSSGLLSAVSRVVVDPPNGGWIVDVALQKFTQSGAAVTIAIPSAGIGDPPSAFIKIVGACCGGEPPTIGDRPSAWDGPAVFGH
jgi:Putative zinc-finger/WD40-like Beta Propeller Repeat